MSALQRYDGPSELPDRIHYSTSLSSSTLLPAMFRGKEANVFYGVEYARMVDIPVLAAITGIHVIDGKPTASAGLMTALVRRAGHKFRIRTEGTLEEGTLAAVATLIREDDPDYPFESRWTIERAIRARLLKRTPDGRVVATKERSAWDTYLEAMLKARATSEVCREGAEEALYGIRYTAEELGADVDADGEPVYSVTQVAAPPTPQHAPQPPKQQPAEAAEEVTDAELVDTRAQEAADAVNAGERTDLDTVLAEAEAGGYLHDTIRIGTAEGTLAQYVTEVRPHVEARHGAGDAKEAQNTTEEAPAAQAEAPAPEAETPPTEAPGEAPAAEVGVDVLELARAALEERDEQTLRDLWRMAGAAGQLDADVIAVVGDDDLAALDLAGTVRLPLRGLLIAVNGYVGKHAAAVRDLGEPMPADTPAVDAGADPWASDPQ